MGTAAVAVGASVRPGSGFTVGLTVVLQWALQHQQGGWQCALTVGLQ